MIKLNDLDDRLPYSLKFFLIKTKKAKNKLTLYCRIIMNRAKSDFRIGMLVDEDDWDHELGRFKAITKHNHYLNHKLSEIEGKIYEDYLKLTKGGVAVTASILKDAYKGKVIARSDFSTLEFLDLFIQEAESKPQEYGKPTIRHYYALKSHLKEFFKSIGLRDLSLESFNRKMLDKFDTWLLTWKHPVLDRPMNRNTANRYLTKFKVVIHNAVRKEILLRNPYNGFVIRQVRVNKVHLTEQELAKIREHDLGGNPALMRVRDIFLFSTYTGLRFSDAMSLRADAISEGKDGSLWLTIEQIKTKDPLHIPLLKPAVEVFWRHEEQRKVTGYVLPRLTNQKLNLNLKEIARIVGINKKVTHHVARHTFATTIMLEKGVDIKTVSTWLGHSSIKSTEVYAHVTKQRLSETAHRLDQIILGQ